MWSITGSFRSIVCGCLLTTVAPATGHAQPDRTSVAGFTEAFVSAARNRDARAWGDMVTDSVVMMAPSGRVLEGRGAFVDLWTRTFAASTGPNPLHVTVLDSRIASDLAVVRAEYGPDGEDPVGQYVWLLERVSADAPWSLAWWIFNRRSPPAD